MKPLNVNDSVYWHDPDHECSGPGVITDINGDVVSIRKDDGGEVEALSNELTHKVKVTTSEIDWDTDGADVDLPQVTEFILDSDADLFDVLSYEYGFCVISADYSIEKP